MSLGRFLWTLLFGFVLMFLGVQNPQRVGLTLFGWKSPEIPLILVIFGSALLGALIAAGLGWLNFWRLKRKIRKHEQEIALLRQELSGGKNPEN